MEQSRGLIKYTSRDYNSLVSDFWDLVPKLTDLWKPEADADPGVVLGKYLASVADMLGVNLDLLANELYGQSVTQRKNAEKIFGLIGYIPGWYTAARTEVTFTNTDDSPMILDFGFNGANFATLQAFTDITQQPRIITYNVLPTTNSYGAQETRSKRSIVTDPLDVFALSDKVTLQPNASVTRVAIEGELRNETVSVTAVKNNNLIIKLPSQHLDTTAVWVKAKSSLSSETFLSERWIQVASPVEFNTPEPRFAVTYDNYGNAQVQISNYLNQLANYDENYLVVYWIECSGIIGSVNQDVLSEFEPAIPADSTTLVNSYDKEALAISNLSNTVEVPHSYTVTGGSPETAREAYINSRSYINTWDSLITLPDFQRFIDRKGEGVDCGLVIDCQKALEINLAIYNDTNLTDAQKQKMYITRADFPYANTETFNWREILSDVDTSKGLPFPCNFKTYTAVCYVIHNNFQDASNYTSSRFIDVKPETYRASNVPGVNYTKYKAPAAFLDALNADFRPIQAMSVELEFGYSRIFPWYVVGEIYPINPVSEDNAADIVAKVKEALALYFAPANRSYGQKPTVMEVVEVIQNADSRIRYFDAGSLKNPVINWGEKKTVSNMSTIVSYDIEYFNPISFARYKDVGATEKNIRIAPEWILK